MHKINKPLKNFPDLLWPRTLLFGTFNATEAQLGSQKLIQNVRNKIVGKLWTQLLLLCNGRVEK